MRGSSIFLALVCVCSAGCSPVTLSADSDGGSIDGASSDGAGGADANIPPGIVNVRVVRADQQTVAGARVSFNNPDGTPISVKTTGDNGEASETVPFGASVTVGISREDFGGSVRHSMSTVTSLVPGETIEVGSDDSGFTQDSIGRADFMTPGGIPASASTYSIGFQCNRTQVIDPIAPTSVEFFDDRCVRKATSFDVLGIAFDNQGKATDYAVYPNVKPDANNPPLVTGGVLIPLSSLELSLSNARFGGFLDSKVALMKGPSDYDLGLDPGQSAVAMGGGRDFSVALPRNFIDKMVVQVSNAAALGNRILMYSEVLPSNAQSFQLDVAATALPEITGVGLDDQSPDRPSMSWQTEVDASVTGMIVFLEWETDTNEQWTWGALLRPGAPSPFQFPVVPGDIITKGGVDAWPPPDFAALRTSVVGNMDTSGIPRLDSFDKLRQHQGTSVVGDDSPVLDDDPGATFRLSAAGKFSNN